MADATDESVRHPLPHIQSDIDARGHYTLDELLGVGQQHFVVSNMDADRRQAAQIRVERRSNGILRVVAVKVGVDQTFGLFPDEIGIGLRTALSARAAQRQIASCRIPRHRDSGDAALSNPAAAQAAVGVAVESFGGLDVLVNNAGYGNVNSVEDTESSATGPELRP